MIECSESTIQSLYFSNHAGWCHVEEGLDLLKIGSYPFLIDIKTKKLAFLILKEHLARFIFIPYCIRVSNISSRSSSGCPCQMIWPEYCRHLQRCYARVGVRRPDRPSIWMLHQHSWSRVVWFCNNKCLNLWWIYTFVLIWFVHEDLVITRVCSHHRKDLIPRCSIY